MTDTKYASAVEPRSALSDRRPCRRTSILMIDAKYGLNIGPRPSVIGNRRLLVRRAVASAAFAPLDFVFSNNVQRARSVNIVHTHVHRARYANLTAGDERNAYRKMRDSENCVIYNSSVDVPSWGGTAPAATSPPSRSCRESLWAMRMEVRPRLLTYDRFWSFTRLTIIRMQVQYRLLRRM